MRNSCVFGSRTWSLAWPVALVALTLGQGGCDTLRARARAQKGVEKYRDGDVKAAAALFRQAADIDPTVPPIIINRGFTHLQLYQQSPRSKEGIEAADLAIKSFKDYMQMPGLKPEQQQRARDYLLQTFVDARRYEEAVEYFKPQVERQNPDLEALTILGNIAKSIGKTEDSRKWLERRVQANPKDTDGYVALAIMNWDVLCADSQCRTPLDQRRGALATMTPEQRIQKSNEGIDFLKKAIALSPQAPTPVIYANLLLRERSYAQPSDDLKRTDLEQATGLMRLSIAMQKAATGASGATPAAPAAATPDAGAAPADNIKVWTASEALKAVESISTTLPPPCPILPPPLPPKKGKLPDPVPQPTAPCVPLSYLGMPAPAVAPTAPAVPGAPAIPLPAAPAPTAAPAAAPAAAAPVVKPAPAAAAPVVKPAPAPTKPATVAAPTAAAPAPKAPATPAAAPAAPKPAAKKVAAPAAAPASAPPTPTKPPAPAPAPAAPAPEGDDDDAEQQ